MTILAVFSVLLLVGQVWATYSSMWTAWTELDRSECPVTCGGGEVQVLEAGFLCTASLTCEESRQRRRTLPVPCNYYPCPVDGGWSDWTGWSEWTPCTVTCGPSVLVSTRTRSCDNPYPSGGGDYCDGRDAETRSEMCNMGECPVDGGWTEWSESSRTSCSVTCGPGTLNVTRTRSCTNPPPSGGGAECAGDETETENENCDMEECSVDGGWTEWSESSRTTCTVTCGTGTLTVTLTRSCTNPPPSGGGAGCAGAKTTIRNENCDMGECPVDGGWTEWSESSRTSCSVTCGPGTLTVTLTRSCTNPPPSGGGAQCTGDETLEENEHCDNCPDPCPSRTNATSVHLPAADEHYFWKCTPFRNSGNLFQCPDSTIWSQQILSCVHKLDKGAACTEGSTRPDYADGCKTFFVCGAGGTEHRMSCPSQLMFDQEAGFCDWPNPAKCVDPNE